MATQTATARPASSTRKAPRRPLAARTPALTGLLAVPGFLQICVSNALAQSFGQRMQALAVGWLVLEMSGSTFWVGIVNGVPAISIVIFSLAGGVLADRLQPRRVLIASRAALALAAVVIALLATTGGVQLGYLLMYVLIVVGIAAIDMPVSRSLLLNAVGNGRLLSASAAQSAFRDVINIAAPLGIGMLISTGGSGVAFWVLSAGYAAAALLVVRTKSEDSGKSVVDEIIATPRETRDSGRPMGHTPKEQPAATPLADVLAGLAYIRTDSAVAALVLLGFLVPVAGIYFAMMPVYAREVLNVGAGGLGVLAASFSAGSLLGSVYLTARGSMSRRSSKLTLVGATFGAGMTAFALSDSFALSCGISFLMGVSAGFWLNLLIVLVQLVSIPEMKGRVASVSTMAYQLIGLGWLAGGTLASLLGLEATVAIGGIIFAGASTAVFAISSEMRAID
jgi:hypothetical protein